MRFQCLAGPKLTLSHSKIGEIPLNLTPPNNSLRLEQRQCIYRRFTVHVVYFQFTGA